MARQREVGAAYRKVLGPAIFHQCPVIVVAGLIEDAAYGRDRGNSGIREIAEGSMRP